MLARGIAVALALISARNAKFGRGVVRKCRERFLEFGYGLVVFLQLRFEIPDEIVRVGLRREFRDMPKGSDGFFRIPGVFVDEAQVVPCVGIFGPLLRG